MDMTSCGWLWLYAGAAMMLMELLSPGFVVFFFGLAAATVGLLKFAFGDAFALVWQISAFSALSIVYIAVLRRALKSIFLGAKETSQEDFDAGFVGRTGMITVAVAPPQTGRVMVGDAEWTAASDTPLAAGDKVRVVAQNNLTLRVAKL